MKSKNYSDIISKREKEVLELSAQGLTIKQISLIMDISPTTVISHRKNIRAKLNCKNCVELIHRAYQLGLLKILKIED